MENENQKIADLIMLKYFAGKMGQYSATVDAMAVDIKEALDQKDLLASQMREDNLLLTTDYDYCRKKKEQLLAENLVLRGALEEINVKLRSVVQEHAWVEDYCRESFKISTEALSSSPSESLSVVKEKFSKFVESQKDLPPDFAKILNEEFWELL